MSSRPELARIRPVTSTVRSLMNSRIAGGSRGDLAALPAGRAAGRAAGWAEGRPEELPAEFDAAVRVAMAGLLFCRAARELAASGLDSGSGLEDFGDAGTGFRDRGGIMDQCYADKRGAAVDPVGIGAGQVGAGEYLDASVAPQPDRGGLAIADVEPQEEAAGGTGEAESAFQRRLRRVELGTVERAVFGHVFVVVPQRRRSRQRRQRRAGDGIAAQPREHRDQIGIAGDEAGTQASGVGAF